MPLRFPSRTATVLLRSVVVCGIAALLTCSVAFAWGRKPPKEPVAVSYGATALVPLKDSSLTAALYDLSGGEHLSAEESLCYRQLHGRAEWQRWNESEPQGLLAQVLPGVRILHEVYTPLGGEHLDYVKDWAFANGHLYPLDALNRVLLDAGFTFDSTEMATIAKVAVLFAAFGKRADSSGRFRAGSTHADIDPGIGFPAITFLSVKRGEWKHPRHGDVRRGVSADCIVDGRRRGFFIEFTGRARAEPEFLFTAQGEFLMRFA